MSVLTRILVDGQYVERLVDPNYILARNREDGKSADTAVEKKTETPSFGLLTRTLLGSPTVNDVLVGNVRYIQGRETASLPKDVVFVGENYISIKEIRPDGSLGHVAEKADFKSSIQVAKIFGEPSALEVPLGERLFKSEKVEESPAQYTVEDGREVSSQMILLLLESADLLFLYAHQSVDGSITFHEHFVELPYHPSSLIKLCRHLAVDFKSRALLIAAHEAFVSVQPSPPMDQLRASFWYDGQNRGALHDSKQLKGTGLMLKAEFLCPPSDSPNLVVAAILSVLDSKVWLSVYDWDSRRGFLTLRSQDRKYLVGARIPSLLIPLQTAPGLVLVVGRKIILLQDALTTAISPQTVAVLPKDYANDAKRPLICSWTYCQHSPLPQKESFYLAREDGRIYHVELGKGQAPAKVRTGKISCAIGRAFVSLDATSSSSVNAFITTGSMSSGQVFFVDPFQVIESKAKQINTKRRRMRNMLIEDHSVISNWTPTVDFVLCPVGQAAQNEYMRRRIFATSGKAPHGAVTELRQGMEARVGGELFQLDQSNDTTGLWILPDYSNTGAFVLVSTPFRTSLLHLTDNIADVRADFDEQNCGADLLNETIAFASLGNDEAVQITRTSILKLDHSSTEIVWKLVSRLDCPSEELICFAVIHAKHQLAVTAVRGSTGTSLKLVTLQTEQGSIKIDDSSTTQSLTAEPTALALMEMRDGLLLWCATGAGTLELYTIDSKTGFSKIAEHQIAIGPGSPQNAPRPKCESLVVENNRDAAAEGLSSETTLLCGLRDGGLYAVRVSLKLGNGNIDERNVSFRLAETVRLGITPVRIIQDIDAAEFAVFAICGEDLCYIRCSDQGHAIRSIDSIWFTDSSTMDLQQPTVHTLGRMPIVERLGAGNTGAIFCATSDRFILAQLDEAIQTTTRRLSTYGTPTRIAHLQPYDLMVVASVKTGSKEQNTSSENQENGTVQGMVEVLSLKASGITAGGLPGRTNAVNSADDDPFVYVKAVYEVEVGERIYALMIWNYVSPDTKNYTFVVIGTSLQRPGQADAIGRIFFLRPRFHDGGAMSLRKAKVIECNDGPVYAVGKFDNDLLIFTAGRSALIFWFSHHERKWIRKAQIALPSPGIQIEINAPHVHIATTMDSTQTFTVQDVLRTQDSLSCQQGIVAVCGDGKARDTAHLLDVNFRARDRNADGQGRDVNVLLLSDKAGIVAGLLMPPHRLAQHAAHRLFEGALPRSIVRFRRAGVRPPWRRPSASSGQPPAGVLVDDILGASLDGTFTAISILSDDSWRLLSFLQRVLTHAPTDVHYAPQPDTRLGIDDYEDEVGGAMRRSNYHVDGDLLARFLYRHTDPVGALHAALLLPVRDRAGQIEQRFAYVRRLVAKGLGPRQAVAAGAPDGVEGRVEMEVDAAAMTADLERLVDWLRQVLMPVL